MFIISYCSKILQIDWYKNVQQLYFCVPYWTMIEPKYLKHFTFAFFLLFSDWVLQRSLQPFQVSDTKWLSFRA